MIFLRDDDHHQSGKTPNFVPSPDASRKFLFNTNEHFRKSAIAVTHSKSTTAQISIQYKWQFHDAVPLAKKVANSALRTPRA
jgi:hypothetical protein